MILYHEALGTHFKKFGINLPLKDDRAERVFSALKKKFTYLAPIELNLIEQLSLEDLSFAHSQAFIEKWHDLSKLKSELAVTYDSGEPQDFSELTLEQVRDFRDHILLQGGATYKGLELALENSFCFFLGGGMHHARKDSGSGFCPIHDLVIAVRKKQQMRPLKTLIIDVDAHMGDGTSEITLNDSTIETLSLHMSEQWPYGSDLKMTPSTVDVGFKEGEDLHYIPRLKEALNLFDDKDFDFAIVVAGADPYEKDALLSSKDLKLTKEQLLERDLILYHWCKQKKLSQLWVMAGGYGDEAHSIYTQFLENIL